MFDLINYSKIKSKKIFFIKYEIFIEKNTTSFILLINKKMETILRD